MGCPIDLVCSASIFHAELGLLTVKANAAAMTGPNNALFLLGLLLLGLPVQPLRPFVARGGAVCGG